ncbi:sugar ABC transporter substrate-binding protein [Harryflintia acetispora]|uniref:Xylose-binding protein n=1 Tax=Harryflintia acetispora TaxID=1849041 RepID=A0A9X8Y8X7_9FIRM|nr:substrate-binding domain-containing protein [Harryflintia acetispora]TCL44171.1 xylose-binding protein [Harryflintia acetispora]
MKRSKIRISIICMCAALILGVCGCSQKAQNEAPGTNEPSGAAVQQEQEEQEALPEEEGITVGVAQCTTQEERWRNDANALQKKADELGLSLQMVDAANDTATQATQIENLVSSGVDVILVSPTDSDAITPALAQAKAAGIPVVVWGRQANTADQDFFIINDFVETGKKMAQTALEACSAGNVVLIGGDKSSTVPTEMTEGMMSVLQPRLDDGSMKLVFEQYITNWMPDGAMSAMENALTQLGNGVDLVLCHNDGMAGGAIQALEGQGLAGTVPVVGMDAEIAALQRIVEGKQYSTVIFDHEGTADICLRAAQALAKGEPLDSLAVKKTAIEGAEIPTGEIPTIMITNENIMEVCVDSGIHTKEEIYLNA